ncbi:rRNA-processing protein efg1 [Lecanora helva]
MSSSPQQDEGPKAPRRHANVSNNKMSKKRNKAPRGSSPPANDSSVNRLKSKIRSLTRSLDHGMKPQTQVVAERALAGYKRDLENIEEEKRKKALIGRYHMVRFFERQKATRHLKKAKKRLESSNLDTPEREEALKDVHITEVDLNYTQYYPLDAKYESIYKSEGTKDGKFVQKEKGNGSEAEAALASRPTMWTIVESCMKEGTLEALRDGKMTRDLPVNMGKKPLSKQHMKGPGGGVMLDASSNPNPPEAAQTEAMDVDDDSDGGFFEK